MEAIFEWLSILGSLLWLAVIVTAAGGCFGLGWTVARRLVESLWPDEMEEPQIDASDAGGFSWSEPAYVGIDLARGADIAVMALCDERGNHLRHLREDEATKEEFDAFFRGLQWSDEDVRRMAARDDDAAEGEGASSFAPGGLRW